MLAGGEVVLLAGRALLRPGVPWAHLHLPELQADQECFRCHDWVLVVGGPPAQTPYLKQDQVHVRARAHLRRWLVVVRYVLGAGECSTGS